MLRCGPPAVSGVGLEVGVCRLGGDLRDGLAHGLVVLALGEDLQRLLQRLQLALADHDTDVLAPAAADLDPPAAAGDLLVQLRERAADPRDVQRLEGGAAAPAVAAVAPAVA